MKSLLSASALALMLVFACQSLGAQNRQPDLVSTSIKLQKLSKTELNVIWSIKNQGTADANLVGLNREPLVSYQIEGTSKKEFNSATNWLLVSQNVPIRFEKSVLKPGESASGSFLLPYIEQENLVSYRFSLDPVQQLVELNKANNITHSQLVGR